MKGAIWHLKLDTYLVSLQCGVRRERWMVLASLDTVRRLLSWHRGGGTPTPTPTVVCPHVAVQTALRVFWTWIRSLRHCIINLHVVWDNMLRSAIETF